MPPKKESPWSEFERITKIGLEALGYTVSRDVLLAGNQVDLYAELSQQLFLHKVIVECKNLKGEIGVGDVRQLHARVDSISTKAAPVSGLMVSRRGFTKTARTYAACVNIRLFELTNLLNLSFDPLTITSYILSSFEKDELRDVYVDLSCSVNEIGSSTIYKPVEKFLDKFFAETKKPGVAILGNFGSGKTSLCKHYSYLLAKRYLKDQKDHFLPIYINLRDFDYVSNLEDSLFNFLRHTYGATLTRQGLSFWLSNRPTLLLLDGFDEMASRLDRIDINRSITQLGLFCNKHVAKVILTCRTHFFKTEIEEQALGEMLRLYIRDWGTIELEEYVSKSLPAQAENSLMTIRTTYNLEELAKTPIFLNMITATIEEVKGDVNQAKLYQIYTDRWIQEQDYRSKLSPADKEMFMEELAFEMFLTGKVRINHSELPARVKTLLLVSEYDSVVAHDRDIRTCSFLIRDSDGQYQFVHKSYMEFFVAHKLAKEVKGNKLENFGRPYLSIEIAGFFANYFEDELEILIRNLLGHSDTIVRANSAIALGCGRYHSDVLKALALSIKTDDDNVVKLRAVDALSSFQQEDATAELIELAKGEGDFAIYCFKKLGSFMSDLNVLSLCRSTLSRSKDLKKISAVLENIIYSVSTDLEAEVDSFIDSGLWENDAALTKLLIETIEVTGESKLALKLGTIEKSAVINYELASNIKQVKQDLTARFRFEMLEEATRLKNKGFTYSRSEGTIRRKFSFLVDDIYLKKILDELFPNAKRK